MRAVRAGFSQTVRLQDSERLPGETRRGTGRRVAGRNRRGGGWAG